MWGSLLIFFGVVGIGDLMESHPRFGGISSSWEWHSEWGAGPSGSRWSQIVWDAASLELWKLCGLGHVTYPLWVSILRCKLEAILFPSKANAFFLLDFIFVYVWLYPWHTKVPRPGVELTLQQWQCWILNPLCHQGTPKVNVKVKWKTLQSGLKI